MRVLAFDASSTVGWASFASARSAPVLGDFEITPSINYGCVALDMQRHVLALIAEHQPEIVGFEAPIFLPRDRWHTRRFLTSLVVVIELVACMRGLRCLEVEPSAVKRALVGPGATKDDMETAAVNMGWPVANHHQADACGVALGVYSFLHHARA